MKKNLLPIIILTIITSIALIIIFKPVLQHPNGILYSKSVDPLKSYYNFSYYLKHDSGIKHDGINYPYGDHLQYINSHPLYVTVLKFIDKHIYPIANFGVAILNLSMIFSFLIAMPFLYLILRRFKLPAWYSIIVALLIGFMNPQFDRIHGHFEMVYWFFIPMFWYLLIRWKEDSNKWLWGSLLVLIGCIGGFISAYFAAFYAIFLFAVLIAEVWINRKELNSYYKIGVKLLLLAIVPILMVKGLVGLTDWVDDRPYNPWGFYVFHSTIPSVFFPSNYPFKELLNLSYQWEGRAYIGLPAAFVALSIIISFSLRFIKNKRFELPAFFSNKTFHTYLIAATLVLLFSMCFPFKWGFGFLLDLLPPVKQFRALGRFTWIFYYVFTIFSAYLIYQLFNWLKETKKNILGILVLSLVFILWGIDANKNILRATRGLFNKNDKLINNDDEFLGRFVEAGINPGQFQAIFTLPYSSTCGDKLLFERGMTAFGEGMKCSYHTGIPLIQSFSPRLSFSQALSSIQLLADSAIFKSRLDDMNQKPVLLVCTKQELNEQEKNLTSKANVFWEDKYITMSTLPVSAFKTDHNNWKNSVDSITPKLNCENGICTDINHRAIYHNSFENLKSENSFCGEGALFKRRGEVEVFNGKMHVDSGKVEISFWLYFDTRQYDMPQPILRAFDNKGEEVLKMKFNNREVHDVYQNWVRISKDIDVRNDLTYQITAKGKYITIDDLLIKPVESNVLINKFKNKQLFNNFPLAKK